MNLKGAFALLGMCFSLSLFSPKINADNEAILFPESPFDRITLLDSNTYQTTIERLDKFLPNTPINEVIQNIHLAKSLPLFSWEIEDKDKEMKILFPGEVIANTEIGAERQRKNLSDKVLSFSLVGTGNLNFPKDFEKRLNYTLMAELFIRSPLIDDYLSDGNKLYLAGGYNGNGIIDPNRIENLSSIQNFPPSDNSFFVDMYLVPTSPYSNQFLIGKIGVDNLGNNLKKSSNLNISLSLEFPPIFWGVKLLKDFKISPYLSVFEKIPFDQTKDEFQAEIGAKIWGKSKNCISIYGKAKLEEDLTYSIGLKLEL